MGLKLSKVYDQNNVNYDCPKCKNSGKIPNISGRFYIINKYQCQCNGCKTIYPKSQIYKPVVTNAKLLE